MKTFISILIIASAGILIFLFAKGSGAPASTNANPNTQQISGGHDLGSKIDPSDNIEGNKNAKVVLIEYSDFQCPACANYFPIVNQTIQNYQDKIAFVYRHYPLTNKHPNALAAALAAEAAGKQGKFWEMYQQLFENQNSWVTLSDTTDTFINYAKKIGLNTDTFKNDLSSKDSLSKIANDVASGDAVNLTGTPTFVLNGTQIKPVTVVDFSNAIDQELKK